MKQKNLETLFESIDDILTESMGLPPNVASCGGWVSPDASTFHSVRGDGANFFHASFVANNPALFGITDDDIKQTIGTYAKRHGISLERALKGSGFIDTEDSDRLQQRVYEKGWVRVIYYDGEWHFTVENIGSQKNKKTLELMAQHFLTAKYEGVPTWTSNADLDAVVASINNNAPVIHLSMNEIAHGMLEESLNKNGVKL